MLRLVCHTFVTMYELLGHLSIQTHSTTLKLTVKHGSVQSIHFLLIFYKLYDDHQAPVLFRKIQLSRVFSPQ